MQEQKGLSGCPCAFSICRNPALCFACPCCKSLIPLSSRLVHYKWVLTNLREPLFCVCSYSAAGMRLSQLKGDNFPFCSSWAQDSYLRVGLKIRNKGLDRKEFPGALSVSIAGWRRSYLCSLKHSERECPKSTIHLRIALYNFLPGWTHLIILCLHCLQKGKLFLSQIGPGEDNIW